MTSPAPYPADTKAKGWRFELDHERIRQSDTWALAAPEIRPWLLMLWMTAWEQTPCGSLPDDDELIAVRIGMPLEQFQGCRNRLMRGWWRADDGRLYHHTLTERVLVMMETKNKERRRKADYRARMRVEIPLESQETPEMSHGTDTGQTQDYRGSDPGRDDTGTGTRTYIKDKAAAANISSTVDPGNDPPPSPPGEGYALEPQVQYAVIIRRWEKARGKAAKLTSSDPRLDAWAKKRITEAQLHEAYELAVADRELNDDPTAVGAGFIDVFLAKVLNPPGGGSALNRASASAAEKPWQASWSGIVAKGRELGIEQQEGETPPEFKASVFAAAAMTDEEKSRLRADWGITV